MQKEIYKKTPFTKGTSGDGLVENFNPLGGGGWGDGNSSSSSELKLQTEFSVESVKS